MAMSGQNQGLVMIELDGRRCWQLKKFERTIRRKACQNVT
jgi:hypothetical protein